jgi:hypothetical protein
MSSLCEFFSASRFKLYFMDINSLYVGIFYPSGEQSDDLFIKSMSSRAKRGDLMSLRKGMGLPLSLLSSQRRLLCRSPIAVEDRVITSDLLVNGNFK